MHKGNTILTARGVLKIALAVLKLLRDGLKIVKLTLRGDIIRNRNKWINTNITQKRNKTHRKVSKNL